MLIDEVLAAKSRGERVAVTNLVHFDFEDEPFYAWPGEAGTITAGGQDWLGLGKASRIDALPLGIGDSSGQARFSLSGVDKDIVRRARSESEKVVGREVTVWKQFLSGPQRPLDDMIHLGTWIMMEPRFTFSGPQSRTISVAARSIFDDRKLSTHAYYSVAYQKALYPDDEFFEFTSQMVAGLTFTWPIIG